MMCGWRSILKGCTLAYLLSAAACAIADEPAMKSDWPHVRGAKYDAISAERGIVESWPEQGPPLLWTFELGQGYSGFVTAGERVFTQFQTRTGQFVICLDAATGYEIWRQRVDWPWQPAGAYPGPYSTPTWSDGRLYYSTPAGTAGCLDAASGREIWSLDVLKKFDGKGTEFGYAATPLVEYGRVILPVGGKGASVVALDAKDGSVVWQAGDDQASYCPIYPVTLDGRRLAIGHLRNSLVAHDMASGELLWRKSLSQGYDEHSAWPLYAEPNLLMTAPFRAGARLYRLGFSEAGLDVKAAWGTPELSNDVCSSVLVDGFVYGFDLKQPQTSAHRPSRGRFKCLDFATGKVRWETDQVGQATIVVADGKLILLNDSGTVIVARVNSESYEEFCRAQVLEGGLCWTPPALSNERLFVRNQAKAVCLFLGSPDRLEPNQVQTLATAPAKRFEWASLLTLEPEFPHDAPTSKEAAIWFRWCVAIFGASAVLAAVVAAIARVSHARRPLMWFYGSFVAAAFLLGLGGTTIFSALADKFVLTWPVCLYVAFRLAVGASVWAEVQPNKRRSRMVSRLVMLAFLAICFGYYRLCMAVGYVMAWGFLAGFLPAAPAAIVAARSRRVWIKVIADVVGFAIYFWFSAMMPAWKDAWLST
jgi:outer membrane protein assembly factor BamB